VVLAFNFKVQFTLLIKVKMSLKMLNLQLIDGAAAKVILTNSEDDGDDVNKRNSTFNNNKNNNNNNQTNEVNGTALITHMGACPQTRSLAIEFGSAQHSLWA
jgi:hypothetical protein